MSTSHQPNLDRTSRACQARGNWSGFHIASVVVGFMFFWPLGLLLLFWILAGRQVSDLPAAATRLWSWGSAQFGESRPFLRRVHSDNVVLNEYQQAQMDRIEELKAEIAARSRRFHEYRSEARRRADQEEFDHFMNGSPSAS